jgi:diadenylate cyclase
MFSFQGNEIIFNNGFMTWVDLALSILLLAGVGFVIFMLMKRTFVKIVYCVEAVVILLAWMFSLQLLWGLMNIAAVTTLVIFFSVNVAEVRPLISNTLGAKEAGFNKRGAEKIFDRHALYVKIDNAVSQLSKTKTGAIITLERNVAMDDFVKSGTILNAPVTPELLTTIFYPGTRLHDGAVVIRKDLILAASVYYTPTTKPLTGKFGSRHRAGIGISEVTDSVTIVVSEETGRISLAIGGELIPVNADNFLRTFEDYMFAEDKNVEKE